MTQKWILLSLILLLTLAACNGDVEEKTEEATPVNAQTLISNAAAKIDEANTFELVLEVSGAPILLNAEEIGLNESLAFRRAQGVFVAPDKLGGTVEIALEDIVTELEIILVGNQQFIKQAFITGGEWQEMTFSENFTPASLKGETGIANAIRSMQQVEYVGEKELDGLAVYHIRGVVDAGLVKSITVGFIGTSQGNIQTDLYVRKDDGLLEKLVLQEPLQEGAEAPTTWTISLYNYNEEYTIEIPEGQE
ncbi:MAG: LppX_LprAFG lipoprotein [Anaerolineae bacterium]|nr:LppX_LprAFG lipoprotein [Anaerolineae bacterium]